MTENKRIIKFRAWDRRRKKMIFGPTDENVNSAWVFTMAEVGGVYDDVLVLMQSTGLLDKNKKEIYEGDIVRYAFDWDYADKEYVIREFKKSKKAGNYIGQVEWEGEEFAHFVINPKRMNLSTTSYLVEVIGNLYENPELIKS